MLQFLVLERVEPSKNIHRFYVLAIELTLFGDVAFCREWGRLGHRSGPRRLAIHADLNAAKVALATWLRRKKARGYRVVS